MPDASTDSVLPAFVTAATGTGRGVIATWPGVTVARVVQSIWREYGLFLVAMSSPLNPASTLNLKGTSVPDTTVVISGPGGTFSKPRRQSGCVSNASELSPRAVVPWTAL